LPGFFISLSLFASYQMPDIRHSMFFVPCTHCFFATTNVVFSMRQAISVVENPAFLSIAIWFATVQGVSEW